jgi:hypothetical protein
VLVRRADVLAGSDGRTKWSHAPRALAWFGVQESGPDRPRQCCAAGGIRAASARRRIVSFDGRRCPCALRLTGTTQLSLTIGRAGHTGNNGSSTSCSRQRARLTFFSGPNKDNAGIESHFKSCVHDAMSIHNCAS